MGSPSSFEYYPALHKKVWRYGYSMVNFEKGKVTGWSNLSNNLKAWIKH